MEQRSLCGLATVLCLAAFGIGAATAAGRPNIILCMTDDQGWGDTSYNGHPHLKTPNLDAMAAAGIRFDEEAKKDVDITEEETEIYKRLTEWEKQWRESVTQDQAVYKVKRK